MLIINHKQSGGIITSTVNGLRCFVVSLSSHGALQTLLCAFMCFGVGMALMRVGSHAFKASLLLLASSITPKL